MSDLAFNKQFPDKARDDVLRCIADKDNWGNCPKCDWLYQKSVLSHCPLCRYQWRNGQVFEQPKYESSSLT